MKDLPIELPQLDWKQREQYLIEAYQGFGINYFTAIAALIYYHGGR